MKFIVLLAVSALTSSAYAAPLPASFVQESAFAPVLGGSVFSEAGQAEGNIFSVFPLNDLIGWGPQHVDSVLFLQPQIGWQEGGATQASLGLGFRQLFGDPTHGKSRLSKDIDLFGEGWYLGGNVFADGMQSERGLNHWQMSTGIEVGSRYISLHANYYWPLSGEKRWGQSTLVKPLGQTRSRNKAYRAYELAVGPRVNSGPLMGTHDIHVTTSPTERVTATTREKLFTYGFYDEALRGWDTDVSVLVPGLDKYMDLRLVAGLYGFDGGGVGVGFQGWQVGAEFRPVPAVVLMATHFNDDRHDDGEWMVGVRLEIPLGTSAHEGFRLRKRGLSERLTEPVRRRYSPTVASGTKLERVTTSTKTTVKNNALPASIEGLNVASIPRPGDVVLLEDGTMLVVEADGKTLRPLRKGEPINGLIAVIPEPSRMMLLLIGLSFICLRRRR